MEKKTKKTSYDVTEINGRNHRWRCKGGAGRLLRASLLGGRINYIHLRFSMCCTLTNYRKWFHMRNFTDSEWEKLQQSSALMCFRLFCTPNTPTPVCLLVISSVNNGQVDTRQTAFFNYGPHKMKGGTHTRLLLCNNISSILYLHSR